MSDTVIACTRAHDEERVDWLDGNAWRNGTWAEFGSALGTRPWVLLLDGARVTLLETRLPVRDLATARRAAPFAIEDQLAQPLDAMQVSVVPRGGNDFGVAVCARAEIDALRARLAAMNLRPELVTAEPMALPHREHGWSVLLRDGEAIIRTGIDGGAKFPLAALPEIVPQLREQHPDTATVSLMRADTTTEVPGGLFDGLSVNLAPPPTARDMLDALQLHAPPVLLEASASAGERVRARRWWTAAAAAGLFALLAYPVMLTLGNLALERQQRELAAANVTRFSAAFPEITRVVNPRVQAEQALAELRAGAIETPPFLDLLAAFERVFARDLAERTAVRGLAYVNGVLEISVHTPDMAELERVRTALDGAGLGAQMLSAESTDDGVVARLRLREST